VPIGQEKNIRAKFCSPPQTVLFPTALLSFTHLKSSKAIASTISREAF